jgi:hypothetical protein
MPEIRTRVKYAYIHYVRLIDWSTSLRNKIRANKAFKDSRLQKNSTIFPV